MNPEDMQISEAELRSMTAEMVELHESTFPTLVESMSDLGATLRAEELAAARAASRRRFLIGTGGVVAGTLLVAATGSSAAAAVRTEARPYVPGAANVPVLGRTPASPLATYEADAAQASGDVAALRLNASLENLAVFAYSSALTDAGKGKFGKKVPAAVAEFAMHAKKQHADHAAAFNAAVKNAGGKPFTKPTPALTPAVLKMYKAVNSIPKLAMLALTLENTAAATYIKQMGELTRKDALDAVATIAPVERQHAAILSFVLGDYPVPDTFVKLTATSTSLGARTSADLKG